MILPLQYNAQQFGHGVQIDPYHIEYGLRQQTDMVQSIDLNHIHQINSKYNVAAQW